MNATCQVGTRASVKADAVVVFVFQDQKELKASLKALEAEVPHVAPLIATGDFSGKKGQTTLVYSGSSLGSPRLILAGLGTKDNCSVESLRRAAASATKRAAASDCASCGFVLPSIDGIAHADVAQAVAEGSMLSQYRFDKYKTMRDGLGTLVSKFIYVCDKDQQKDCKKSLDVAKAIVAGTTLARDLANAPNGEVYPAVLGKRAQEAGKRHGFSVTVLDKRRIEALKMGGLLGVNQGSVRPPVFIVMEHMGGKKGDAPIVLVGKGVTFDTGGISIKPAPGMSDMKGDMHGAASVIGTMATIAELKLPLNVVGLVPATENMPSGSAYVPGDILTFMNGKTAEIDNTDAEGRLILADALCYAARYKPKTVIDLATLTGACVIALGNVTTGMLGTDSETKDRLRKAAERTSEYVCELPLYDEYEELISSDYADIKNSGGRSAGTITAALFLKHFVSYPWVHLDIAGTALLPKPTAYHPKGGSGVGVRLLTDMLRTW